MQQTTMLSIMIFLMTNLASTTLRAQSIETTTAIFPTVTSTPNAPGHVKIRRIPKPKLFRSNPHKLLTILANPDSDIYINDDGIIHGRRRSTKIVDEKEQELSDYVKIRLLVARLKALEVYRKSLLQS
jgi:hypothetical protein